MSKNATIRLNDETHEFFKTNFEGIQSGISLIVEPFEKLKLLTIAELKGYFSENELISLFDSQNGVLLTPDFIYNKSFLIAQLEDFEMIESGFSRHSASIGSVVDKLKKLSQSQVYMLLLHINIFWNKGGQELEKELEKLR